MYYVYRTTNLVNGKTYIGQHKFDLNKNDNYLGSGVLISKAIKKYGKENFSRELIEVVTSKFEVNVLEKYYIAKERKLGKAEYNIADGGEGATGCQSYWRGKKLSKEHRKKLSNSHMGQKAWNKGVLQTEEAKRKISEANKGKTPWIKGKHHSEETCKKLSEINKGEKSSCYGKSRSENTKRKISKTLEGHYLSDDSKRKISEANKGKHFLTKKVAETFKEYKLNGGTLKWNEFQKEYKNNIGEN